MLQAGMELAESVVCEAIFGEGAIIDPLGSGEPMTDENGLTRMRSRLARLPVEDAIIRLSSGQNHLVNAHLRLGWEANAARESEVKACGFDPDSHRVANWATVERMSYGLEELARKPLSVFPSFRLSDPFWTFSRREPVVAVRRLREELVHRERPSYRESPAFGRASLWSRSGFKVTVPESQTEDPDAPSLAERRSLVMLAGEATIPYAEAIWDTMREWLSTVGVSILVEDHQVSVQTTFSPGSRGSRVPREQRDPGRFLAPL